MYCNFKSNVCCFYDNYICKHYEQHLISNGHHNNFITTIKHMYIK